MNMNAVLQNENLVLMIRIYENINVNKQLICHNRQRNERIGRREIEKVRKCKVLESSSYFLIKINIMRFQ